MVIGNNDAANARFATCAVKSDMDMVWAFEKSHGAHHITMMRYITIIHLILKSDKYSLIHMLLVVSVLIRT